MSRRSFLRTTVTAAGAALSQGVTQAETAPVIMTVEGSISPTDLGVTLPHEHVMVDFIGAEKVNRDRYDRDEVFEVVLPYLYRLRSSGCRALVECTPAYLGRDPELLQRLASASGIRILTNTGYYGAANDKYVPAHAYAESAARLAEKWTREWEEGIEGSGIRPGFIKTGVDPGPLSDIDRKLAEAAAATHLATGLTIAAHTGDGIAALAGLAELTGKGIEGSGFIWVHAQNERDMDLHEQAAQQGAWIEFDGIREDSVAHYVTALKEMDKRGLLGHVLISQDAGWYRVGEPGSGDFRPFDTLFTRFLPALREAGFSDHKIKQLLVDNPRAAFTVRIRAR